MCEAVRVAVGLWAHRRWPSAKSAPHLAARLPEGRKCNCMLDATVVNNFLCPLTAYAPAFVHKTRIQKKGVTEHPKMLRQGSYV